MAIAVEPGRHGCEMARRSCCFAWHGVVQDVQMALKACARCCQGVTPLSSVPRQRPQSSRCDVCEHGASAVSGVSPRVCMFSLALGDARRGCGTVCGQPRVAARFFLFAVWLVRGADINDRQLSLYERAISHGRTAVIHDISTNSLHLKRLSAR